MTFITDFSSYTSAISVFNMVLDFYSIENFYAVFYYYYFIKMCMNIVSCLAFSCQNFWFEKHLSFKK